MSDLLLPICKAIDFIEARLRDEITVAEIANAAGYSLYHFIRSFSQVAWHTPYSYLMRRRLSEAARDLVGGNRRVIDIAIDYRFNNHETFSRAFKRIFGCQPVQWRERGIIPRRVLMPAFSRAYLEHIQAPGFQRPRRAAWEPRLLAGLMAPLSGNPDAIPRLWRALGQVEGTGLPNQAGQNFFGLTSYLDEQGEQVYYLAACELEAASAAKPTLACQTVPGGDYVGIPHTGTLAELCHSLTFLYHTWLPKAGLRAAYPMEIMAYGDSRPWMEQSTEVVLWLPVTPMFPAYIPSGK